MTIYAISSLIQEREVTAHCFGDCGHAILGVLDDPTIGPLIPCRFEACPWLDKTLELGEVDGEMVVLRKLVDMAKDAAS